MLELLFVLGWAAFCLIGGTLVDPIEAKIKAHYAHVDARGHR